MHTLKLFENERELYWLAGLLEGEGCFGAYRMGNNALVPIIQLSMTDEEPVSRAAKIMRGTYKKRSRLEPRKPVYRITVAGSRSIPIMMALRPLMSPRRQEKIDECLLAEQTRPGKTRGEDQWNSKLTWGEVWNIRRLLELGYSQRKISLAFGIGESALSKIKHRLSWKHVP